MLKRIALVSFSFFILSTSLLYPKRASAVYPGPIPENPTPNVYPSAACQYGQFALYIQPSTKNDRYAIRIDDRTNGWNPQSPNAGDYINDNYTSSVFAYYGPKMYGKWISWWMHKVEKNGVYGSPKGGDIYCPLDKPTGLQASYDGNDLVFTWDPQPGAAYYAIRVNNLENGWNPNDMQHGDRIRSVSDHRFIFENAPKGKSFSWWIHAVAQGGIYSDASISNASTR